MPRIPQLNTNIDVSNALFKVAAFEQARQEQAKVDAIREQQLNNANALTQYKQNRLKAAQLKDELDVAIKQIGMIDYSKGVEDHNNYRTWVEKQNPVLARMIPVLDPTDTTSLERGKAWQKRSMELLGSHKAGYVPKEVRLIDESTGEESIEWAIPGEKFVPPKGKRLYNTKRENKEEKLYATEEGFLPAEKAKGKHPFRADRQPTPLPEKDYVEMGVKIGNNLDNPAVDDLVADYNRNAQGNAMFVPVTMQTQFIGTNTKVPFTEDTKKYKRVDLSEYGVTSEQVRAKAKAVGRSEGEVAAALIKVIERKRANKQ